MFEQFADEITTSTSDDLEEVENQADGEILKKRNENIEHFESEFCVIFRQAIQKLLDLDNGSNILYLRRFFRIFYPETSSWCNLKKQDDKDFKQLLTCSLYYRVAHMYRLGVVLASATAFHFQNVLIENANLTKTLLQTRNLKICSFGSGCPSGVIGVAKVLETIAKIMNVELEIFATIIDVDGGWKNASITALTCLEQFHRSTWKINFIEADVSKKKISAEIVNAVEESDIVTMVNVHPKTKIGTILENITGAIRPGSMMFILDSSRLPFIKSCGGQTGEIDNFYLLYEELCQVYTLRESSVKKLFVLYHKYFPGFGCDRKLDVFARVWVRKPTDKSSSVTEHLKNLNFNSSRENQNSLSTNHFFHNWEVRFSRVMLKYGWSRRWANKMISVHQEKRSRLLKRYFENEKLLSHNRGQFTDKFDQDAEELSQSEDEEEEWEGKYDAKKNLARVQIGVSNISIFNLKCRLKREILGPAKKGKFNKKKAKSAAASPDVLTGNTCRKIRNDLLHK